MKTVSVPIEYTSPLVNKYLQDFPEVSHLFEHDPGDTGSFRNRYEVIRRDYHTDRDELVRILTAYNEKLNCGAKTRENLQKLKDPRSVVVITGQQAGVLTGPLYTIYKTITVIQLAREVSRQTGIEAIPVFWVASEDHDYTEIDHVEFVGADQKFFRLRLDYEPAGKYSVGHLPVTDAVFRLLDELAGDTNPADWKDSMLDRISGMAGESDNLADWFGAVMSWLFREHGLVLVNPLHKDLRKLWSTTFEEFLLKADLVSEKLETGRAKVRALGVEPQVEQAADSINLFLYVAGERLPLLKTGDGFTVRGRERHWTLDQLRETARKNPEMISPNVVLRPVAQDVLLPILAYVAGPGEISYYALYREIYPIFNQAMPVIYPRVNITLVERGTARHMERYGVDFTMGPDGLKKRLDGYLDEQDRLGIDRLFGNFTADLEKRYRELIAKAAQIDPELTRHGNESLNKILHQVAHFEKKARQHHRKSCDMVIKRFRGLEATLFPRNNWQERVLNIFPYLFKYGPEFIDNLVELPLLGDFHHKLVFL